MSKLILIPITIGLVCATLSAQQAAAPPPAPKAEMKPPGTETQKPPADAVAAAAQTPPADATPKKGKGEKNALPPGKDPTATRSAYVIGPDDSLFIRVWDQPQVSGAVVVGPDGTISLQLIHEVKASGLTPSQLEAALVEKLKEFLEEPIEVNVQVTGVRSRTFIIQGPGVGRNGVFPLTKPTTVLEALVNGGGFRDFANTRKIYILRGSKRIFFNYNDVSKGKHMEQNIEIQNGDQIFVP